MKKPAFRLLPFLFLPAIFPISGNYLSGSDSEIQNGENYDVSFYFLDLNVSDTSTYVRGSVSVYLNLVDPSVPEVVLDMADFLEADSVAVNGRSTSFIHDNNRLTVNLPAQAKEKTIQKVEVFYRGPGSGTGDIRGIYSKNNATWDQRVTWTLSEPFFALNWFPCKQSLTDKADSVYLFLSTDKNLKAGSNGLLTSTVELPDNRVRYEWKCRYPIDYYLISFAVSRYRDYSFYVRTGTDDSILVQNYIYDNDSYFEQNRESIDRTGDMIRLFVDLFGPYPYMQEKYGHSIAPSGGGMEHQTMTTLSNFSFSLVSHELAHQWFGNSVTCKTWQDIWINEGFASYAEYLAYQNLTSQESADSWITRYHDLIRSVPGGSVYVPENYISNEDRIFDYRLTYAKGAAIIHMIRQEVGNDDLFFIILREFLQRYRNNNASGEDFRNLLEEMTGLDFSWFFEQWYQGEGYPVHSINWNHRKDTLYINSLQTTTASTPQFNVLLEYEVTADNRDTLISHRQESGYDQWRLYLPGKVTHVRVDPRHWLLMRLSGLNHARDEVYNARYVIIPNPAQDKITLHFTEPVDTYEVYVADAGGKILMSEQSSSPRKTIDVKKLAKGIYFIVVEERKVIYPAKFIKN